MATKAKTLQVKDKEKDDKAADAPEKDLPDAPSPLLDLSDAAVKKMIKQAKKRGFVTFDQLNEVLPSDTTSPEQIEDIMSMLSDMGINVSEAEEADTEEDNKEEAEDETDNELVEVTQKAVTEVKKSEPGERTDDPVRMYLREMGTVELLSREGEIAIAKRIEAGREARRRRGEGSGRSRGRIRHGRRRVRKPDVARGDRGRAEAEGGRDLRQDRRQLQEAAPPAGAGHLQPAAERDPVAGAGAQVQEAEGRDHRRGEVAAAQPGPHRFAGRAALRHQQEAGAVRGPPAAARPRPTAAPPQPV